MGIVPRPAPFAALGVTGSLMVMLALSLLGARALLAQVGHPPGSSPYREIPKGHAVTPFAAFFAGDGGRFGIAPGDGQLYGLRYDIRTGSTVQMGLLVGHGQLERLIVDPFVPVDQRVSGPVDQSTTFVEADVQLNLTGGKRWNRFAPFIAGGVGLAFAEDTPADSSGFELGNKFYFAPHAGFRFFIADRVYLRADARVIFWKLSYPTSFTIPPPDLPGTPPVIVDGNTSEWDTSGWYQAGLGFSFSVP